MGSMAVVFKLWKFAAMAVGGMVGWIVGSSDRHFPWIAVAIIFILYDAYTAFKLDKRVHAAYPGKDRQEESQVYLVRLWQGGEADHTQAVVADSVGILGGALGVHTHASAVVVYPYRRDML